MTIFKVFRINKYRLWFVVLALLVFLPSVSFAASDVSYKIQIGDVIEKRTVTITYPVTKEKYLLYLGQGCGMMQSGQKVELVVRSQFNGGNDYIKQSQLYKCAIEKLVKYNGKIIVDSVFGDDKKAFVTDEKENRFYISFNSTCSGIIGYRKDKIFVFTAGEKIRTNDQLIIPNKSQCRILYAEEIVSQKTVESSASKDKIPTDVTGVKAFPKNGGVFLTWRASSDDKGIAYYVVSYSLYRQDIKNIPFTSMPNRTITKTVHYTFSGLENEQKYYFYVIAVDTAGNISSNWSSETSAVPKGSIMPR